MFKYISSTKLNIAILVQIIGVALFIKATPLGLALGAAGFTLGAILYRRELKIALAERRAASIK